MKDHDIKLCKVTFLFIGIFVLFGLTTSCNDTTTQLEDQRNHPFPRLGMWWLDPYEANVEDMARYDVLLDSFDDEFLQERLLEIQELNPNQLNFKPISPTERQLYMYDWEKEVSYPNPEVTHLPSEFFLLQTGTEILENVDASETKIYVEELVDKDEQPLFHINGEVAIGQYETAKIIQILWDEKALIVERGYIRPASKHIKGEKIASHIRFWPGSWVMNVTDQCPRLQVFGVDEPVNYIEYYFYLISGKSKGIYRNEWDNYDRITNMELYDGVIIDRFEDKESWLKWVNEPDVINLDLYHDNSDVSSTTFDQAWENGTTQLNELLRDAYPDIRILRNNPITSRYEPFDGQVYESFGWSQPSTTWWEDLIISHDETEYYSGFAYLEWWNNKTSQEPMVLFEVYEDEVGPKPDDELHYDNPFDQQGFEPNYQRMRFSLTSALLGNGYYSYEMNTQGHGSLGLMWFDEYDNAGEGKGYLGFPITEAEKLDNGMYQRNYEHGLVLVNPTEDTMTLKLDRTYRKIKGTQQPLINTGESVDEVTIQGFDGIILIDDQHTSVTTYATNMAVTTDTRNITTVTIDKSVQYQVIDGFGASGAWWAQIIGGWSDEKRNEVVKLLFNPKEGIGLSIYRYNIGAGDGSEILDRWRRTKSIEVSQGIYNMNADKESIWVLEQAAANGVETLIAFANSPPARLTVSGKVTGASDGSSNIEEQNYIEYADYLLGIIQALSESGIDIDYVSPLNEPQWEWSEKNGQEGCHYSIPELVKLTSVLQTRIIEKGMDVQITSSEAGEWKDAMNYAQKLYDDPILDVSLNHFAGHSYWSNAKQKSKFWESFVEKYSEKKLWMSEWTEMEKGRDVTMESALVMANVIFDDLTILNANTWQYWIAVSKYDYRDGLIYTNDNTEDIIVTKRLFTLGQFSKFIKPGAIRCFSECSDQQLRTMSFYDTDDEQVICVILNESDTTKEIDIQGLTDTNPASVFVTDDYHDLEEIEYNNSEGQGQIVISPRSITTIIFDTPIMVTSKTN